MLKIPSTMMKCLSSVVMFSTGIILILVLTLACAAVIPESSDNNDNNFTSTSASPVRLASEPLPNSVEERADISYDSALFKEIDHDILQVTSDPSKLSLSCHSNKDNTSSITWKYHGLREKVEMRSFDAETVTFDMVTGPPVARWECILQNSKNIIANNTLVYTGDGIPPFLQNHGQAVSPIVLNETTAQFPCVLNYPLENLENVDLQLFKNGEMVENKNNCLSYTPELGYFLNLTLLDNPLGNYKCKVLNSTDDDYVSIKLGKDNFIRVVKKTRMPAFYAGAPQYYPFECNLPRSMFEDKFVWHLKWTNGSYTPLDVEPEEAKSTNLFYFSQTIRLNFMSENISRIACTGFVKGSMTPFNNSIAVEIKTPHPPNILNGPSKGPIIYEEGKNLTCITDAAPVTWTWLKNGEEVRGLSTREQIRSDVRIHTLSLLPSADDKDSNYTCVVTNFLGKANYSFRVQLPTEATEGPSIEWLIGTIAAVLAVIALFFGLLYTFFKIKVTPRTFNAELIRKFLEGSKELQYNELEPYASVSYDDSREIPYNSLIFERELKGGNFGKVHFGRLVDKNTNSSTPVAIKTMKDDLTASERELEFEFCNFLNEIKIMQYLGSHKNVVSYVGAVTSDIARYSAYLVVEYCSQGDLATYLRTLMRNGGSFHDDIQELHHNLQQGNEYQSFNRAQNRTVLRTSNLMKWGEDIAAGMEYISSRNLVHMDLAARNVLLGTQGINSEDYLNPAPGRLIAKISDFGLSKNLDNIQKEYYQIVFDSPENNRPRKLPLRWLSPEALESLRFTSQSDVWAMGVAFWEMFTFGQVPYKDLPDNGDMRATLISHLKSGYQLSQPEYAPIDMWEIIVRCWAERPCDRPSFRIIKEILHAINENFANQQQRHGENSPRSPAPATFTPYTTIGYVENLAYNGMGDDDEDENRDDSSCSDDEEGSEHNVA